MRKFEVKPTRLFAALKWMLVPLLIAFVSVDTLAAPVDDHCVPFQWQQIDSTPHGAIVVPLMLNGELLHFQLDTGIPWTLLYGRRAAHALLSSQDGRTAKSALQIGAVNLPDTEIRLRADLDDDNPDGSLGLNALRGKLVALDYLNQRLCVFDDDTQLHRVWQDVKWNQAKLDQIGFFVHAIFDHTESRWVAFDTGSASFPVLIKHRPDWLRATGLSDIRNAPIHEHGQAFGAMIDVYGAPISASIQIGPVFAAGTDAYYIPQQDAPYIVFGNALFIQHVVVLDLREAVRFGFVT